MSQSGLNRLDYVILGGAPRVDLRLSVNGAGQGTLYIGTPDSLPGSPADTAGFYSANLTTNQLADLVADLQTTGLMETLQGQESASPDSATGYLTLTFDDSQSQLVFADTVDASTARAIQQQLDEWMQPMLAQPLMVAQLGAKASATTLEVTLSNNGSEPLRLMLFDESVVSRFLKLTVTRFAPDDNGYQALLASWTVSREQIVGLQAEGVLTSGWQELSAGPPLTLNLAWEDQPPAGDWLYSLQADFWLPGDGLERRLATVRTPIQPE